MLSELVYTFIASAGHRGMTSILEYLAEYVPVLTIKSLLQSLISYVRQACITSVGQRRMIVLIKINFELESTQKIFT